MNGVVTHARWWEQLAEKLNLIVKNYGKSGTSVDYSSVIFHENFNKVKRGDVIVLALTDTARQWLDKNNPSLTSIRMLEKMHELGHISSDAYSHAVYHFTEVVNLEVEKSSATNFINSISYLTLKKDVKLILLPCFNHNNDPLVTQKNVIIGNNVITAKKGQCLWNISTLEFSGREKKLPKQVIDHRFNHLSPPNHKILAEKIYDALTTNCELNLNPDDFLSDLFTASQVRKLDNTWKYKYNVSKK